MTVDGDENTLKVKELNHLPTTAPPRTFARRIYCSRSSTRGGLTCIPDRLVHPDRGGAAARTPETGHGTLAYTKLPLPRERERVRRRHRRASSLWTLGHGIGTQGLWLLRIRKHTDLRMWGACVHAWEITGRLFLCPLTQQLLGLRPIRPVRLPSKVM